MDFVILAVVVFSLIGIFALALYKIGKVLEWQERRREAEDEEDYL